MIVINNIIVIIIIIIEFKYVPVIDAMSGSSVFVMFTLTISFRAINRVLINLSRLGTILPS